METGISEATDTGNRSMESGAFSNGITLGFSPCPNDTFIFNALVNGPVNPPCPLSERLEDVETLNRLVLDGAIDVSKVSYHLFGHVRDRYCLLRSGGALGRGCGPLLVARDDILLSGLRDLTVALPGEYTTATLLLRMFDPGIARVEYIPFNEIMPRVASGEFDAGVIIHESRFTYQHSGLVKLLDLGEWWESTTGCPIPLGGIVARRSLGRDLISALDFALASSVSHAFHNRTASLGYIRQHSQEMSRDVCAAHIKLYVNDFSMDLGDEGEKAVNTLLDRAAAAGIIPAGSESIFY